MNNSEVSCPELFITRLCGLLPPAGLVLLTALMCLPRLAQANVYATNLKLNGGVTNVAAGAGTNVTISYVLNEAATAGVTVDIKQGSTTIRSLLLTNGAAGTLKGTNSVVWDARDNIGHAAETGLYSVSVTPAAAGFSDWTQTSLDTNLANQIWEGRGIAINRNTNSIYYGRIFVGNAFDSPNADIDPFQKIAIHKINADGTFAEEGYSTGGYDWSHGNSAEELSPWKLEVGADDRVYVNDHYLSPGIVLSFDQAISTNSLKVVLDSNNFTNQSSIFSGMAISGTAENLQLWLADNLLDGVGIRRWDISSSGSVASNDLGMTIVQDGFGSDLDQDPEDVAVDSSNRIYVVQRRQVSGDPSVRLLRFPAYAGTPETLAEWKTGSADDTMAGAYGVAVDPTSTYVAVAFQGVYDPSVFDYIMGSLRVFSTSNGAPVKTLTPETSPSHFHWDASWDNVGNLYAIDGYDGVWRVYSPPGANQATTVALPRIQVNGATPAEPRLGPPAYDGSFVHFTLFGEPNVTYIIQISTDLQTWTSVATNSSVFANRDITIPAPPNAGFIRAVAGPYRPAEPWLSLPVLNAGTFQFSLLGEPYLTYAIQESADLQNWTTVGTSTSTNASRSVSISSSADQQFFRAKAGP